MTTHSEKDMVDDAAKLAAKLADALPEVAKLADALAAPEERDLALLKEGRREDFDSKEARWEAFDEYLPGVDGVWATTPPKVLIVFLKETV
mmetsp:Transcript_10436/g.23675  ORF Transcript_10436/g.23675 Transcript_10436/m.23675 type:complete len:91 (+) Transcript_10436:689-961(+)